MIERADVYRYIGIGIDCSVSPQRFGVRSLDLSRRGNPIDRMSKRDRFGRMIKEGFTSATEAKHWAVKNGFMLVEEGGN